MSQITHDKHASSITVEDVFTSEFQKEGTLSAQLRSKVTTVSAYPSKQVGSSLEDNLFDNSEFGFTPKIYTSVEERVAWLDVPITSTIETVVQRLNKFPKARLYRILSNQPILTEQQEYAVREGIRTLDKIANAQLVKSVDATTGEVSPILDAHHKHQYRRVLLSIDGKVDIDLRDASKPAYVVTDITEEVGVDSKEVVA